MSLCPAQVAKVGEDSFGNDQIRNLQEQGIDCSQVSELSAIEQPKIGHYCTVYTAAEYT
jgi:sugar/nucleoside kinase (ribokinase family)